MCKSLHRHRVLLPEPPPTYSHPNVTDISGYSQDLLKLQPQRGQKIGRPVDVHGVWWHTHESNNFTTGCRSTRVSSCPDALLDQLDHARAAGYAVSTSVRAWWTSANATNTIATIRK